jgi:hypothetical protein
MTGNVKEIQEFFSGQKEDSLATIVAHNWSDWSTQRDLTTSLLSSPMIVG